MSERILEARQLLLNAAREGDVQAVRDSLSQVLREEDLTEADLLSIVQKLTQFGMHKEALGWLQEPVEDVEAWQSDLVLALLRLKSGDVQEALTTLESLAQSKQLSSKTYQIVAQSLVEQDRFSQAAKFLALSFAGGPTSPNQKMQLAAYHWLGGQKEEAKVVFREAYEQIQEDWAGFFDLPELRQKTFRGESLVDTLKGAEENPSEVRARLAALSNADSDANILFNQAVLSAQLGDFKSAVDCINLAYRVLPKDLGIEPAQAIIYYHKGALQQALLHMQISLLRVRNRPADWIRLGFLHQQLGATERVLSALYESFQLHRNPIVLLCIAHMGQDFSDKIYDNIVALVVGKETTEWIPDIAPYSLTFEDLGTPGDIDATVDKIFKSSSGITPSINAIKRDLAKCELTTVSIHSSEVIEANHNTLTEVAQRYSGHKQTEHFLQLAKIFAKLGYEETLTVHALARYSYAMATMQPETRAKRQYLQAFFFLQGRLGAEEQRTVEESLFNGIGSYFGTFNIHIEMKRGRPRPVDRFFEGYLASRAKDWPDPESLGTCVIEIATANIHPIRHLIFRLKQSPRELRSESELALKTLVESLQQKRVFLRAPTICLKLLARISYEETGKMLVRPDLYSTGGSRREVAKAVLESARADYSGMSNALAKFCEESDPQTKNDLAFSLLIESGILRSAIKAQLAVKALGASEGTPVHEHLVDDLGQFAGLFDRFITSTETSTKVALAGAMQARIRSIQGWMKRSLRKHPLEDALFELLRRIQGYVLDLSAGLVVEAELQVGVITDKVAYKKRDCRIILEVSNPKGGSADSIELKVLSVEGKYQVEEWRSSYPIGELGEHATCQQEVFVNPIVGVQDEIQLEVQLLYKTADKVKTAQIDKERRTVRFFPITEFKAIPTIPYDIQSPAREWFRGRRELLSKMAGNLRGTGSNDIPMIIYGLRRAGKTSLVQRFLRDEIAALGVEDIYLPIWVNIASGDAEAYSPTIKKFRGLATLKEIESDGDLLRCLLDAMTKAAAGRVEVVQGVSSLINKEDFDADPFGSFATLLDLLLKPLGAYRLLIALDEWAGLLNIMSLGATSKVTADMFVFLSNLIQNNEQLTFIFSGTPEVLKFMELAPDLEKICVSYKVGFLDEASARQLVQEPVEGWFEYGDGCIDHIIYLTHCHPYLVQLLCMYLVSRMNYVVKHPTINLSDIDAIEEEIIEGGQLRAVFWSEFEAEVSGEASDEQKALFVFAQKSEGDGWVSVDEAIKVFQGYGHPMSRERLLSACSALVDAEMLEARGEEYRVTIPLFREWLKTRSLREVGLQRP